MEIVEIKMESVLLTVSEGSEPGYGGGGDHDENEPDARLMIKNHR